MALSPDKEGIVMAIIHGPHGATLEYDEDEIAPGSLDDIQQEWKCLSQQLCNWPFCECDPVAAAVVEQIYGYDLTVPQTFTNHKMIKQHNELKRG
jgi:hypothetical protein